jgi:hypothetical protein
MTTRTTYNYNYALLQALIRRRQVFTAAGVPNLAEIAEARVSNVRPLCVSDYIIVFTESGLMVAKGMSYVSKCPDSRLSIAQFSAWPLLEDWWQKRETWIYHGLIECFRHL